MRRTAGAAKHIGMLGVLALALFFSGGATGVSPVPQAVADEAPPNERLNIVNILLDDASSNLLRRMPTIQSRMVKRGTRMPNAIYSVAWCGPSRASMFTGRYPHNHGVGFCMDGYPTPEGGGAWDIFRNGRANSEASTYATWLRDSGYYTGYIGKYMNGYDGTTTVPPGWDRWFGYEGNYGSGPTYEINENGTIREYSRKVHDTDYMAFRAKGFIRDRKDDSEPFLLTVATNAPHVPDWVARRHKSKFPAAKLPKSPNFNEANVSDKGSYMRGRPKLTQEQVDRLDLRHRQRLRSMLSVDEMVGGILNTLQETGQMKDTYIFLWNDNGYHLGNHRIRDGKLFPYEEDVRYPMVVRGPGVPKDKVMPQEISNIDIAPTFADIANTEPESSVDGRSFLPLLGSSPPDSSAWRDAVLTEFKGAPHPEAPPPYNSIRTNTVKLIEYEGGDVEFYDLRKDPFELQSNARDPRVPALLERLHELDSCADDSCRAADGGDSEPGATAPETTPGDSTPDPSPHQTP